MILIDFSKTIARKIIENNVLDGIDELYILISYTHSDHVDSLVTRATHVKSLPCYCFVFEDDENLIYYSADNNNIEYIKYYIQFEKAEIYTEISNNSSLSNEHLDIGLLEETISFLQSQKNLFDAH